MSTARVPVRRALGAPASVRRRPSSLPGQPRYGLKQPDERFFGAQVPGDNPELWIAERAPPTFS